MAKPNNNYIKMMMETRGEDWITTLRPDEIQNNTKRIIKDIVRGSVDFDKQGIAFLEPKFMENLFIGVSNELEINTLNYNACIFYYQYYPATPNLGPHIAHLEKMIYIYSTVRDRLNAVRNTGNIGYLTDISGLLFNDRNHLN